VVKAGLSDDLIVTTINSSPGIYNTSVDGIIALKTARVSDRVVSAIVAKANAEAAAATAPIPPLAPMSSSADQNSTNSDDPNDPNIAHDPGIYMYAKGPTVWN